MPRIVEYKYVNPRFYRVNGYIDKNKKMNYHIDAKTERIKFSGVLLGSAGLSGLYGCNGSGCTATATRNGKAKSEVEVSLSWYR